MNESLFQAPPVSIETPSQRNKEKTINELIAEGRLDSALHEVVSMLIKGPFMTEGSCSGHLLVAADGTPTNSINDDDKTKTPFLAILEDVVGEGVDKNIQDKFRLGVEDYINKAVITNLENKFPNWEISKNIKIIGTHLQGRAINFEDDDILSYDSVEKASEGHEPLFLTFEIDWEVAEKYGSEVLAEIWRALFSFLNELYGTNDPLPEYSKEDFAP